MRTLPLLPAMALSLIVTNALAADPYADLSGEALIEQLRKDFSPENHLSYREARKAMFGYVDDPDGDDRIVLVYSGEVVDLTGFLKEGETIPDHNLINTEHTWPQSWFEDAVNRDHLKTDIHHLYPTWSKINSTRGNRLFAEIPDDQTDGWWGNCKPAPGTCVAETGLDSQDPLVIQDYSEVIHTNDGPFEPREAHKGNVARSMFYVYVIYGDRDISQERFEPMIPTLLAWHEADPVDGAERARSKAIADGNVDTENAQGNENPFVLYPALVTRVFDGVEPITLEGSSAASAAPDTDGEMH